MPSEKPDQTTVDEFINLFGPKVDWYYIAKQKKDPKGQKVETYYSPTMGTPEPEDYADHLSGDVGLSFLLNEPGPSGSNDHCSQLAVDIDDYDIDPAAVEAALREASVPHIINLSKSGGLHVRLILKTAVLAADAKTLAQQIGAALVEAGVLPDDKKCDYFPKQAVVDRDTNKGNGLNLCYFGDTRIGWRGGEQLTLDEFISLAYEQSIDGDAFEELMQRLPAPIIKQRQPDPKQTEEDQKLNKQGQPFFDGPPCLQRLAADGVDSNRNNFLYGVGVYAKLSDHATDVDSMVEALSRANSRYVLPPLAEKEVLATAKSVIKAKTASYQCKESPLCDVCNIGLCKSRRFGPFLRGDDPTHPLYDDVRDDVFKQHYVVDWAGKPIVMSEAFNPRHKRFYWKYRTFDELRRLMINKKASIIANNGRVSYQPLAELFLQDPKRKTYEGVYLSADDYGDSGYLNLWRGFAVEPKQGDWSLLRDHIWKNTCRKNEELYDYLMRWMAWKVQNPDKVPGVAIVMRGEKGVGKNKVAETFGKLFGQHYYQADSQDQVMGRFGDHLVDTCVLVADEAFWAGDKRHEGMLKGLITSEQRGIEGKGMKSIMADNHVALMVLSNSDYVVPATEGERRFAVYDVGDDNKQDHAYFAAIDRQLDDDGRAGFLHDLKEMDLSGFEVRKAPNSDGLVRQKLANAEPLMIWLIECLTVRKIVADDRRIRLATAEYGEEEYSYTVSEWPDDEGSTIDKEIFFRAYFAWFKTRNQRGIPESVQAIGLKLRKWLSPVGQERKISKRKTEGGKQTMVFILPSVAEARSFIERHYDGEIDWSEAD